MSNLQRIMILEGKHKEVTGHFIFKPNKDKPEPPALLENSGYDNYNKSKRYEQSGCALFPLIFNPTNIKNTKLKLYFLC